jgi:hypothetical protein
MVQLAPLVIWNLNSNVLTRNSCDRPPRSSASCTSTLMRYPVASQRRRLVRYEMIYGVHSGLCRVESMARRGDVDGASEPRITLERLQSCTWCASTNYCAQLGLNQIGERDLRSLAHSTSAFIHLSPRKNPG